MLALGVLPAECDQFLSYCFMNCLPLLEAALRNCSLFSVLPRNTYGVCSNHDTHTNFVFMLDVFAEYFTAYDDLVICDIN